MSAIKKKDREKYNQYKNDVVNGFLMSLDSITEHYSIKPYADKLGLNSFTVTSWVRAYIKNLQSSFKVELENSSLKKLKKINEKIQKEKVKLEEEFDYLRNDKQLLEEEINLLKKDNQLLKEELNFVKKELEKKNLLRSLIVLMNKIVE